MDKLTPVHRRAAGIDVGSAENYVAIPAEGLAPGESPVRVFGVFSAEQDALVELLRQHRITTAAMEATGIYWLSLYDKLEAAGIEVYLVDPHGVKAVPGRKSDWLGLCPGTKISGGRVLSRRTRRVKNRAATILRLAAWTAGKTDTWIGRFYRRVKARRGAPKAVTATARKLACVIYHLLKHQDEFVLLNTEVYEAKAKMHRRSRLRKEAKALGYELVEHQ